MSTSSEENYQSADDELEGTHPSRLVSRLEELSTTGDGDGGTSETGASESGDKPEEELASCRDSATAAGADSQYQDDKSQSTSVEGQPLGGDGREDELLNIVGEGSERGEVEYVSGLDNRYISEDVVMHGDQVELSEEQVKEMKEHANKVKKEGNDRFKSGDYKEAIANYSEALQLYPCSSCEHEVAVCYANRAACYVKMDEHQSVIDDCTKALELEPDYLKAVIRRAQAFEALEKYEEALEDHKRVLELDPSQTVSRRAVTYLPEKIKEQHEKMKAEMIGKLKELGDAVLKPFGLSTSNFQFQQDPNSGGYSVNFKR